MQTRSGPDEVEPKDDSETRRAALATLERDGIPGAAIYVVMELIDHLTAGERPGEKS